MKHYFYILLCITTIIKPYHLSEKLNSFKHTIASHFHKPHLHGHNEKPKPSYNKPELAHLNPFQKFFRDTIAFTQNTKNIFTDALEDLEQEAKQGLHSIETIGHAFIEKLESKNKQFINIALQQAFDINLEFIRPSIKGIITDINRIQHALFELSNAQFFGELDTSITMIQQINEDAEDLQTAGILAVTSALASQTILNKEEKLVEKIYNIYNLYPLAINTIDTIHLPDIGIKGQHITNAISELCEKIIIVHDNLGLVGSILVEQELLEPIDVLKNKVRKLGNSIDFTLSLQPIIIAAPPTTLQATVQLLQSCVFNNGITVQKLLRNDLEKAMNIAKLLLNKKPIILTQIKTLLALSESIIEIIQNDFKEKIRTNPLTTIPVAPQVLLEIVEHNTGIIKTRLHTLISMSLNCMNHIAHLLSLSGSMMKCTNQLMGSTDEIPFINPRIMKGVSYIGEDLDELRTVMRYANIALQRFTLL